MSYAEKRQGLPTGKFIAERIVDRRRYRKRFKTKEEGDAWEAVIDATGKVPVEEDKQPKVEHPLAHVIRRARAEREGWKNSRDRVLDQRLWVIVNFFGGRSSCESVTNEKLREFVKHLKERKGRKGTLGCNSVNRYLAVVSALLEFARSIGISYHYPSIPWEPTVTKPIKTIPEDIDAQLIATIGDRPFQVVAEVFFKTAIKSGEMFRLRADQITIDNGLAWLSVGSRSVPVPLTLATELKQLILSRALPEHKDFYLALKAAYEKLGLDRDLTVTSIRHTVLKRLAKTNSALLVKEFAGHKTYRTTLNYIEPPTLDDVAAISPTLTGNSTSISSTPSKEHENNC